ncbi:MAG TPA: hypothetical protein VLT33_52115, partial [Labilithrix sp.]|nr:hypothetical protein [Labilithrix sp.]
TLCGALALCILACKNDAATAPVAPVVQLPIAPAPASSAPASAITDAAAVVEAEAPSKVEPPPAPPPVACKTNDDCWFDDAKKPIARPAKLRGRKILPCKNGEHVPSCDDGACIVRAYKC